MSNTTKLQVVHAYTQQTLEELTVQNATQVEAMLLMAQTLHKQGNLAVYKRIEILQKLAGLMKRDQDALSLLIAQEGGKPLKDAIVEVTRAIDGVRVAVSAIQNNKGEEIPMDLTKAGEHRLAFTTMEPIGTVVAISAFNHPLNLIVHQVIPAIATGCPVIIKPAATTPLSCLRFHKLLIEAGLPEGWCQVAIVSREHAEKLVTDNRVAFFSFIGSADIGWMLKSKLAKGTRCALEHGGVAPLIFDSYKDIDGFVSGLMKGAFYHAGQVCVSVQRLFIPENQVDLISEKIIAATEKLIVGNSANIKTDVGPLITPKEVDRVESWVNEAITEGATLLTGGKRNNKVNFQPTVLLNPAAASKVSTAEIFGPVLCIYSYSDINEAIKIANSLEVAFQSAVFSDNIHVAFKVAKALNASAVMINDYSTFRTDWMPFAGRKHSGYGVGGIEHTMKDMLEEKMILLNCKE